MAEDADDINTPARNRPGEAAEVDATARRFGTKCMCVGTAIVIGTFLSSVAFAAALATDTLGFNADLRMFLILGIMSAIATGASLLVIGGVDRLLEPLRAMERRHDVRRVEACKRIDRIEQAIAMIAELLPDEQLAQHWRGYAAAVEQGFTERTGTDGPRVTTGTLPPRLGLVQQNRTPDN